MAGQIEPRTECRTPNAPGTTTIPTWKFDLIRSAILDAAEHHGPDGVLFSELSEEVAERITEDQAAQIGSLGWHVTTVKLELEMRGEIARTDVKGPQRLIRVFGLEGN